MAFGLGNRLFAVLLALYLLQSRGISAAACGLWATLSPDPVVAMRTDLQLTALNVGVLGMYIHGNADNSCTDSSSVRILSINQPVAIAQELSNFHGSELYKVCTAGFTVCTVPRLIPFYNPRQGAPRSSMLWVTPTPAWTAPAAAPGVGFTLAISRGTTDYISLTGSGYTFEIGIGLHRRCATRTQEFSGGTLSVTSSSLSVSISATSLAVYSVCMQVSHSFTVVAPWFPLSAALGHSVHNLALGTPTTNVEWSLSSPYARYGIPTVFVAKQDIVADGWQNFAIDTTHDVCSPTLAAMFSIADLTAFNATHVHATVSIPRPSDNPGGGHGILCGNRGVDHPWVLLSTKNTSFVSYCDKGGGVYPSDRITCTRCPPTSNPCNGNGACGTLEQQSFLFAVFPPSCVCHGENYGSACQFFRIQPPTVSSSNGTYVNRLLSVAVASINSSDTVNIKFPNGTQVNCSAACVFDLRPPRFGMIRLDAEAWTVSTNGSQSFSVGIAIEVRYPTETPTTTLTWTTASKSSSQTPDSGSNSLTFSATLSPSNSESSSASASQTTVSRSATHSESSSVSASQTTESRSTSDSTSMSTTLTSATTTGTYSSSSSHSLTSESCTDSHITDSLTVTPTHSGTKFPRSSTWTSTIPDTCSRSSKWSVSRHESPTQTSSASFYFSSQSYTVSFTATSSAWKSVSGSRPLSGELGSRTLAPNWPRSSELQVGSTSFAWEQNSTKSTIHVGAANTSARLIMESTVTFSNVTNVTVEPRNGKCCGSQCSPGFRFDCLSMNIVLDFVPGSDHFCFVSFATLSGHLDRFYPIRVLVSPVTTSNLVGSGILGSPQVFILHSYTAFPAPHAWSTLHLHVAACETESFTASNENCFLLSVHVDGMSPATTRIALPSNVSTRHDSRYSQGATRERDELLQPRTMLTSGTLSLLSTLIVSSVLALATRGK